MRGKSGDRRGESGVVTILKGQESKKQACGRAGSKQVK